MPETSPKKIEQLETEKSDLTAREQGEDLLTQIAENKDRSQVLESAVRIFEHSVADGLKLIDRVKIDNDYLMFLVTTPRFIIKHPEVFKRLFREVTTNGALKDIEANPRQKSILSILLNCHDEFIAAEKSDDWERFEAVMRVISEASELSPELGAQIDDHYAPLLRVRKFKPQEIHGEYPIGEMVPGFKTGETRALRSVEELADEALKQSELLLLPAYYSHQVEDILKKYLTDNKMPGEVKQLSEDFFITKETIEDECDRLDIPFVEIKSKINRARYFSVTAGVKRTVAEGGIVKKLNKSLESKGQKVELVGDKYEVIDDKEKKEVSDGWDDMTAEVGTDVTHLGFFDMNHHEFAIARAYNNIDTWGVWLRIGGTAILVSSDDFEMFYSLKGVTRFGHLLRLDVTNRSEATGQIVEEEREVVLDVAKIRELDAKEKKRADYWSGEEELSGSDQNIVLNGVTVSKDVNEDERYTYNIQGTSEMITDKFKGGFQIKKLVRKSHKLIRDVIIYDIESGKYLPETQEIAIFTDKIDAYKIKLEAIEKLEKKSQRIEAQFLYQDESGNSIYQLGGLKLGVHTGKGVQWFYDADNSGGGYGSIAATFAILNNIANIYYENHNIWVIGSGYHFPRPVLKADAIKKIEGREEEKTEQKEFDFAQFESKSLDFMDELLRDGAGHNAIAVGLCGFDSEQAWQMREKLLTEGLHDGPVAQGLAGLDSERAWQMRDKLIENLGVNEISYGLAGLDSERAWQMRDEWMKNDHLVKYFIAYSLAGLDCERAWQMRQQLIDTGLSADHIAYSLAGLDSERAWQMRDQLIESVDRIYFIYALVGLDSERAWQMRDNFTNNSTEIGDTRAVLQSLAGLDSERAWQMRDKFLTVDYRGSLAYSLAGLDSERAWQMREKLKLEGYHGDLASSLAGNFISFVWQLNLKNKETSRHKLSPEEQKQLDLINLLHHPDLEGIARHFHLDNNPTEVKKRNKQEKRKSLGSSSVLSNFLTGLIGQNPKPFLETMPAKRDRLPEVFAQQLAERIFPEIRQAREKSAWRGFSGYSGLEGGHKRSVSTEPENYLNPHSTEQMMGGGTENMADDREVMATREALNRIIVTGIYGRYNSNSKHWDTNDFPFDAPVAEPATETTAVLPSVKGLSEVSLPKPLEAKIIPERVKGFDAQGQEYDLKTKINNLGLAIVVDKPKAVEKIVYSFSVAMVPTPMAELNQQEYNSYKKKFEAVAGKEMTASLASLPEDLELELLAVIKNRNPKEQIMAIERLVRDLCYYDRHNQEVSSLKAGKSLEEQQYIMEQRLEELKIAQPGLAKELKNKKFAGVCTDFAQLTATLLRRAGFASGVLGGFSGEAKKISVKHAHATAFVLWPDDTGKNRVISIDGTPDGVAGVSLPSLVEREDKAVNQEQELSAEAVKEIQKIIDGLDKLDLATVKKMSNGELERVINGILKYQVKESHLAIIERLFDYYWYTPVHELDLANPRQRSEAILELAGAVERQRLRLLEHPEKDQTPAGNKMMQAMQDFLRRFSQNEAVGDKDSAFLLMEKIMELVQNDLSEVENKSASAIIAYLKAKNILGEQK